MLSSAERDRLSGRSARHAGDHRDGKDLRERAAREFGWRFEHKDMPKLVRSWKTPIPRTAALSEPRRVAVLAQGNP